MKCRFAGKKGAFNIVTLNKSATISAHENIQQLINSLAKDEKERLTRKGLSLFISSKHAKTLFKNPAIAANETALVLNLTEEKYAFDCELTYDLLKRFVVFAKSSNGQFSLKYELAEEELLIDLLKEKGLYAEALKRLKSAVAKSRQYDLTAVEISLLHQHLQLIPFLRTPAEELSILTQIEVLQQQQTQQEALFGVYYQLLSQRYKAVYRTTANEQQEVIQLQSQLQQYNVADLGKATSLIYYYQSMLFVSLMLAAIDQISQLNEQLLSTWKANPCLIKVQPELFVRSASLQSYTHFLKKDIASADTFATEYKALAQGNLPSIFYERWFAIINFQTALKILHKTFQYDELRVFFAANWAGIYTNLAVLRDAERLDILLATCITYFVLEEWDNAEAIILEAKEINQKIKRLDSLYFSFVFHCLILYEKKEWTRLDSLIHAGYHYLYNNNQLRPFEKDLLLFIKKLPVNRVRGMAAKNIRAFLDKLDTYKEDNFQKLHFVSFDFYSWFESKMEGVSYVNHLMTKAG